MFSRAISQSACMTSRVIRSPSIKTVVKRHSHDHAGTPPPPYVQRTAPTKSVYSLFTVESYLQLSEHAELIWEDGVAPETAIDFDVQQISTKTALLWFLSGMTFFWGLYEGVKLYNPRHLKRYVLNSQIV